MEIETKIKVVDFIIGPYTISTYAGENLFIRHESGEGGEFKKTALLAAIDKFYSNNF